MSNESTMRQVSDSVAAMPSNTSNAGLNKKLQSISLLLSIANHTRSFAQQLVQYPSPDMSDLPDWQAAYLGS